MKDIIFEGCPQRVDECRSAYEICTNDAYVHKHRGFLPMHLKAFRELEFVYYPAKLVAAAIAGRKVVEWYYKAPVGIRQALHLQLPVHSEISFSSFLNSRIRLRAALYWKIKQKLAPKTLVCLESATRAQTN